MAGRRHHDPTGLRTHAICRLQNVRLEGAQNVGLHAETRTRNRRSGTVDLGRRPQNRHRSARWTDAQKGGANRADQLNRERER
jgi:hypothetical protein